MKQETTRTRIFSHITRSRFLHVEDSLGISKIRFFVGEYRKGEGAQATAYHFLDADDARPLMADLSWGRQVDIKDFKGSANGGGQPVSRVLKVKGPKEGKFWFQVDNGPGQVIGAGAVKPAGEPTASVSIALTTWEARKLALAIIEYMNAFRVATLFGPPPIMYGTSSATPTAAVEAHTPKVTPSVLSNKPPVAPRDPPHMPKVERRTVDRRTGEIETASADAKALFGPEQPVGAGLAPAPIAPAPIAPAQAKPKKAQPQEEEPEDTASAFFHLVNKGLTLGLLDHPAIADRINAPGSWREKGIKLQAILAT